MNLDSNYDAKWELEEKNLASKSAARIWILASVIVPFFSFFEYRYSIERFEYFLFMFLGVSCLMLTVAFVQKKVQLPFLFRTYGVSVILGCSFSYMAAKTDLSNVHNYLMGISAITLVRGMIYFGRVAQLMLVTLVNHSMAFLLISLIREEPLSAIPNLPGTMFYSLIFMVFSFVGMNIRYKLTKENFVRSLELQKSFDLIEEKQKEILDSIHYASRIQKALITSEKYIDKSLNEAKK
jgi:hypothetical protein